MNKKERHIGKRKIDSSARKRPRKLHTSEYENSYFKKKIALYSKEDIINYNQQCHPLHLGNEQYKQFPKKEKISRMGKGKGKRRRESANRREKEKERRRKKRKGKGKRRRESAKGEGEGEKEKEKKRRKKRKKMEKVVLKVLL